MPSSGSLTDRDLRALVELVGDGRTDDPGRVMPWAAMDGLMRLIPCEDWASASSVPHRGRPIGQSVFADGGQYFKSGDAYDPTPDEGYWRLSPGFRGCAEPGYPGQLLHWSDFSDPEKLLIQLLWPHPDELYWDAERRRQGTPD